MQSSLLQERGNRNPRGGERNFILNIGKSNCWEVRGNYRQPAMNGNIVINFGIKICSLNLLILLLLCIHTCWNAYLIYLSDMTNIIYTS